MHPGSELPANGSQWLNTLLIERKITLEAVALVLGVDAAVVSDWAAGYSIPPDDALDSLAAVLGIQRGLLEEHINQQIAHTPQASFDPFREVLDRVRAAATDL